MHQHKKITAGVMKILPVTLIMGFCILTPLWADQPASTNYTLTKYGVLGGVPNSAAPPASAGYTLQAVASGGIANSVVTGTDYVHLPGYLEPLFVAPGCTDPGAFNFNPTAVSDDGSCYGMAGDLDLDGTVNVNDIVLAVGIIIGQVSGDAYQLWAGDYDGDGALNVIDVVAIVALIISGG